MSKVLHLTLKKKWYDMIASGEKKEEYREIKKRIVSLLCEKHDKSIISGGDIIDNHTGQNYSFKKFDVVKFVNGYGNHRPSILVQCLGIETGIAKPEWSDNWQGEVFVIKLGEIIKTNAD